tara:strand:+ start:1003 stop:1287 length:285 start_codon:yes stop_codon:yes gene_type:complete
MSVARITTVNFNKKEDADTMVDNYVVNAPSEFPEAEQLLQIRTSDTTVVAISLYSDNEAMERASVARKKRMGESHHKHESVDTKVGEVKLNHQI